MIHQQVDYALVVCLRTVAKIKWERELFDPIKGSVYYKNTLVARELGRNSHPPDIEFFNLSTIVAATNNFSPANKLGQGGFGSVYKVESLCFGYVFACACFTLSF